MTSKLVVNTIEADTGISSVSFASSITLSSTSVFHFSDAGVNIGADTNISRLGNGILGFKINGAEKFRIDSSGHIKATGVCTATTFSGSGASLTNLNGSNIASGTVPVARIGTGTKNNTTFYRGDGTFATVAGDIISEGNTKAEVIDTGSEGYFIVETEGVERIRIKHNGNMGVNTNNPQELLHVNGTTQSTDYKYTSHPGHAVFTGDNSTTSFTIQSGHSVNSILVVYNGAVLTPTTDYTVSGTTLSMNGFTPPTNAHICVRYLVK